MTAITILSVWLIASFPLGVIVGRMIRGARECHEHATGQNWRGA